MGGFISVAISSIAAFIFYSTGYSILLILSILITIICFWTWGVMHNYATLSAKARHDRIMESMKSEGKSAKEIEEFDLKIISPTIHDINTVPDKLTNINMLFSFLGVILLIIALYLKYFK